MGLISPINLIQLPPGRKPPFGTPANLQHPLTPDLGCWMFNEGAGSNVYNAIPTKLGGLTGHGTFGNNAKFGVGSAESGIYFDGTDDYVTFGAPTSLPLWSGSKAAITVVAKFRNDAINLNKCVLSMWDSTPGQRSFWIGINTSNNAVMNTLTDGGSRLIAGSTTVSQYVDTVAAWSTGPNNRRIYVNGKFDVTHPLYPGVDTSTAILLSGGVYTGTLASISFDWLGYIYYIYFYGRQLSDADIMSLYADPYQMFRPEMPFWVYEVGTPSAYDWTTINGVPVEDIAKVNGVSIDDIADFI